MVISMSQPWRHPSAGVWYLRARVPADLKQRLAGQKLTLRVGGHDRMVVVREIVKVSLSTKEAGEAKVRHAAVQAPVQERWSLARKTISLSHEQIQAYAGRAYRQLVAEHRTDPGDPVGWEAYQDQLLEPFHYLDEDSEGVAEEPFDPKLATRLLTKLVDIDELIGVSGLALTEANRLKLLKEVAWARVLAARKLERFAQGDYTPDKVAETYPDARSAATALNGSKRDCGNFKALIEGWEKEKAPRQATLDLWSTYIAEFVAFVGHDEPKAVRRQDVIDWKQKLLADGASVKTINDSKLAALKAILGWAVDNGLLSENAAARVSVKRAKKPGEKMRGFESVDAATILQAATNEASPVYHWVPLLCAASGARVSEVCQLRAEDIVQLDGIWVMRIRADAGSIKNANSERDVPLHPIVVTAGFVEFASRRVGPLFFDPARRRPGAKKPQPKVVAKNVAAWVHRLDVKVGRAEYRRDPNHAWRHLFKTLGRDAGVEDSVLDAITGNGPPTVGRQYGETWMTTAARAIAKIMLPGVTPRPTDEAAQFNA